MKKHYTILVSLLVSALCLSGCGGQSQRTPPNSTAQQQENLPPHNSQPPEETTPPKPNLPQVTINGQSIDASPLWDQNPTTALSLSPGDKLTVSGELGQAMSLTCGPEEISFTLTTNNADSLRVTEVAEQRWVALPQTTGSSLSLIFEEEAKLAEIAFAPLSLLDHVAAYWPVSSVSWQQAELSMEYLTDVILNTGCYWLSDGTLEVSQPMEEALLHLNKQPQRPKVWCTINPKGALIRSGTAGQTIDSPLKQQALADAMVRFCQDHGVDGIDIDWEFPLAGEWESFSSFLSVLSQTLHSHGLSLSAAFYPQDISLSPQAIQGLDRIHVMAYDQFDNQGRHATYLSAVQAIDYFTVLGFTPGQLCLGIPAYGRPLDGSAAWPFYSEAELPLSENIANGVYYNSSQTAKDKAVLAADKELGGVFLYHLGCDAPANQPQSLLQSIALLGSGE